MICRATDEPHTQVPVFCPFLVSLSVVLAVLGVEGAVRKRHILRLLVNLSTDEKNSHMEPQ
jgi:hypothetical protein